MSPKRHCGNRCFVESTEYFVVTDIPSPTLENSGTPPTDRTSLSGQYYAEKPAAGLVFTDSVLSAGIEPTLHPPQGCVLSVERRERSDTITGNLLRCHLTCEASLHTRSGVLLDKAALCCLIDRLLGLGEDCDVLGLHQILHRVLHSLRAARIEHAAAKLDSVGFLS
jgi:hypothetical protein